MAATKRKNMNPRIERKITRISGVREVKQTFLIICEGVNTEPDYFNAFRLTSATVKAIGQGMGTLALVQKAINIKEQERQPPKKGLALSLSMESHLNSMQSHTNTLTRSERAGE